MLHIVRNHARTVLLASRTRLPTVTQLFRRPVVGQPLSTSRPSFFPGFGENNSVLNNDDNLPSFRRTVPPSETLYVGNLPYSTDVRELREKFSPFGELVDVRVGSTPDGRSRGFAHVEFSSVEEASAALESIRAEQWCIQDRDIRLDFAPPRLRANPEPRHVLYISDFVGDEQDLRAALKDYESSVISINLLKSPLNGELQGVGFIEFLSIERAAEVLNAMNGVEYAFGSKLRLRYAQPKASRSALHGVPGGNGRSDRVNERWQGRRTSYGEGSNRIYNGRGRGGGGGGGGGRGGRGRDGGRREYGD